MSSLNARLKTVEEALTKINEIVTASIKPVHDRVEEVATFTGVDENKEDKPAPQPEPAQPQ